MVNKQGYFEGRNIKMSLKSSEIVRPSECNKWLSYLSTAQENLRVADLLITIKNLSGRKFICIWSL